jgi:tetratricopeptide (TPR) repeat protein
MKTLHVLRDMQQACKDGDQQYRQGNYMGSVECYQKAIKLCQSLPPDTTFDRRRFEASCYAGLSASLGQLKKHLESFAAANKALAFYDQCGEANPADVGRWLMALVNQGTALTTLGCFDVAVEALLRAKQIFTSHGLDASENGQWLEMVDGNIAAIKAHLAKQKR